MRIVYKLALTFLLASSLILPACTSQTGKSYRANETRQAQTVQMGVITQLNPAQIEDDPQGLGTLVGGVVGGIIGSAFGGGSGRIFTVAGGALGGAVAGTAAESAMRTKDAEEIMVRLDSNETVVVVQQLDSSERLAVGDRVRLLTAPDGSARVRLQ